MRVIFFYMRVIYLALDLVVNIYRWRWRKVSVLNRFIDPQVILLLIDTCNVDKFDHVE
jgi:hypothetical protein